MQFSVVYRSFGFREVGTVYASVRLYALVLDFHYLN